MNKDNLIHLDEWKQKRGLCTTDSAIAGICEPFIVTARTSWPDASITAGDECVFNPGVGQLGDIVAISYHGHSFMSRLIARTITGDIAVVGRTNKLAYLARRQYEIEGVLIEVHRA
jgi:hypothetical protein